MKIKYLILSLSLMVFFISFKCEKQTDNGFVVHIGDTGINKENFIKRYKLTKVYKESATITSDMIVEFLDKHMVEHLLFINEANHLELFNDSEYIAQIDEIKKRILIQGNGALFQNIIPKQFDVSEDEILDIYKTSNVEIKVANILVNSKVQADALYQQIIDGESFGDLAYKYSVDMKSAKNEGVIDMFFSKGTLSKDFEDVAFQLRKDEVSKPAKSEFGYHIIKLLEMKNVELKSYEEMKNDISAKIKSKKMNDFIQSFMKQLEIKYKLSIDESSFLEIIDNYVDNARNGKIQKDNIDKETLKSTMITYEGGDFSVEKFCKRYNQNGSLFALRNSEDIKATIRNIISEELMYLEALELGLDKEEKFKRTIAKYEDNRLKSYARQKLLYENAKISSGDAKEYFDNNQNKYKSKDFKDVKNQIISELKKVKLKSEKEKLMADLKKKHKIVYNKKLIKNIVNELNQSF